MELVSKATESGKGFEAMGVSFISDRYLDFSEEAPSYRFQTRRVCLRFRKHLKTKIVAPAKAQRREVSRLSHPILTIC